MTGRKWSDPVRHERIIARIVECLLEANLVRAKEAWRSRVGLAKDVTRRLLLSPHFQGADKELLTFFSDLTLHPVSNKPTSRLWPFMQVPMGKPCSYLSTAWVEATYRHPNAPGFAPLLCLLRVVGQDDTRYPSVHAAFIKLSENAVAYDHLTQLPDVARTPRPRKPKRTLVQSRADKAAEAAKLWRRRLRLAKAKLEKYTKQQKYYAKKEVKE